MTPKDTTYAQIIVDIHQMDTRTFSYSIPDELTEFVKVGSPVLVPFGNRVINGYVVGFTNYMPENIKPKPIFELLDNTPVFDLKYLKFLEWTSEYYSCSLQTVFSCAIPENFFSKTKQVVSIIDEIDIDKLTPNEKVIIELVSKSKELSVSYLQKKSKLTSPKFYEAIRKLKAKNLIKSETVIDSSNISEKTERYLRLIHTDAETSRQKELLEKISDYEGEIRVADFVKSENTTYPTLKKLEEKGYIEIFEKSVDRNPLDIFNHKGLEEFPSLTNQQEQAYKQIAKSIDNQEFEPILLHGVTGSGKTEVYFNAIKKVLDEGKNAIFLAPEIPIASELARRLSKRFGTDITAIWHSNISEGEKYDVYQKLRDNKIRIIAGARSAVFAPIQNIGLIIIDEEHESSYKQSTPTPRYNAKVLAEKRAEMEKALLVLGSATPDVHSYYKAINTGRLINLPERFGINSLPDVSIIDMKQEQYNGNRSLFSRSLKNAINANLENGHQSILLINRRGYATTGLCSACGHTIQCNTCSIPMILHKSTNSLKCHYCNYEQPIIERCPECGEDEIKYFGIGTQRIEEDVKKHFPTARTARIDSDILTKKNAHIEILNEFSEGNIDILIGTQMIAKGLDNPNVTLVGVLMADMSFNLPDFRSSERGFQLLTQVAGRAGRGDVAGKVYFQTYAPDYFALKDAQSQDYKNFYNQEIAGREELGYPPFSQIIRIVSSSKNNFRAERIVQEIALKLKSITEKHGISEKLEILGPTPCIIERIKDEFRYQILIKNRLEKKGHFLVTRFIKKMIVPDDIKIIVDIEPLDIL